MKPKSIHRVIDKIRARHRQEAHDSCCYLTNSLRKHNLENPDALVSMQTDANQCFCRVIASMPHFVTIFKIACVPVLYVDGTFFKTIFYDSITICTLSAKLRNGKALPLAIAFLPVESAMHIAWPILMIMMLVLIFPITLFFLQRRKASCCSLLALCKQ